MSKMYPVSRCILTEEEMLECYDLLCQIYPEVYPYKLANTWLLICFNAKGKPEMTWGEPQLLRDYVEEELERRSSPSLGR